jgi:luciferase family oxidoreductase group 1
MNGSHRSRTSPVVWLTANAVSGAAGTQASAVTFGMAPILGLGNPPADSGVRHTVPLNLSVLDLVPVRSDQTSGDAARASLSLARTAEATGFHRYWAAEHHNMPAVAATNPPVLIAMLAAATERIRVGSGGVMLPNHAPLVVAEQFALLEAAHPGRIDLGIGRAPGTDPVTRWVLRNGASQAEEDAVARFPEYVRNVAALMAPGGAALSTGRGAGEAFELRATPRATGVPPLWLLGSSDYSARLAAELGLPYVFAHHFAGRGTAEALALYRQGFRPSEVLDAPRTFLTVNAAVAETTEEAERLALPQLQAMVALRTGGRLAPQRLVEEAEETPVADEHVYLLEAMRERWVIGDAKRAAVEVQELAATYGVDEVMVHPVAGALTGTAPEESPAREATLTLLAQAL